MTRISPRHPRYASLKVRAGLAAATASGVVVPEGLIAHGRGEAFDYLLGERTTESARRAARHAALWLVNAHHPVVSVNGNVAALAAAQVAELARSVPALEVEVNLFHRTLDRAQRVARLLRAAGVRHVLGIRPTARIPGLPSDRALVDRRGIAIADVCIVPLEDGDRAAALHASGKRVIAIDLNPLSRTAQLADIPIIDELTRALPELARAARSWRKRRARPTGFPRWDRRASLAAALRSMERRMRREAGEASRGRARGARQRPRGTGRRSDRTR